ncbi:restriction endonuclease subunit S [Vibrio crassostreae]|uniref:restriction endonuclease subunit S n=1 Tax=Vibrio crassostreae TaxID=246167 RepID=UPI002E17C699|nr:restriction endonuclease subunit S [Vibrio crassostreae]
MSEVIEFQPSLRFKSFNGSWKLHQLKDTAHSFSYGLNASAGKYDGIHKYIRITDINEDTREFDTDTLTTPETNLTQAIDYKLQYGDLLFARTGASVGKSYYYKESDGLVYYAGFLIKANIKQDYDVRFIFQSTLTREYQKFVSIMSQRSGQPGINAGEYGLFEVNIPNLEEQIKIGDFFESIDHQLKFHQAKLTKLQQLKKAMLGKMFPKQGATVPEVRFSGFNGDWACKKFGDCALIQRGGSPRPIESYTTNDPAGINWVKIGDVSKSSRYITKTKEKIMPEGEKLSRRVYKGDLILSNSMSFGRPYIMAIEGCIHDGWLLIRDEKELFNLEYLLQLLSSNFMLEQYRSLASGGVVINLNSDLVQSTSIWLPSKAEQTKIGEYFQSLDHLIALQQQQIKKLENVKQSFLEKMFV